MKRRHVYGLRSMMHECEQAILKTDRSQIAEWERDLLAEAACALWDLKLRKFNSCLERLTHSPSDRKGKWIELYQAVVYILTGAWRREIIDTCAAA